MIIRNLLNQWYSVGYMETMENKNMINGEFQNSTVNGKSGNYAKKGEWDFYSRESFLLLCQQGFDAYNSKGPLMVFKR